ncbi:MAG: hypothetical protein K5653_09580 [Clostridiales bacterium]|nr:hypothetical protein [Clostridiales bacterium]
MSMKKISRVIGVLIAVCMIVSGASIGVYADTSPNSISNTYSIEGVNYYKVDSTNFTKSNKAFFYDLMKAGNSTTGNKSAADNWSTILHKVWDQKSKISSEDAKNSLSDLISNENAESLNAAYFFAYRTGFTSADSPKLAEDMILKGISNEADLKMSTSARPSLSTLQNSVGQLQSETSTDSPAFYQTAYYGLSAASISSLYAVAFVYSDFKVNPLLPDDEAGNYVITKEETSDPIGTRYASKISNSTGSTVSAEQSLTSSNSGTVSSEVSGSSAYTLGSTFKIGIEHELAILKATTELEFSSSAEVEKGWGKSTESSNQKDFSSTVTVEMPAYTGIMLKQSEAEHYAVTEYNCPISISYRVRVIEYQYINSSSGTKSGSVLANFGSDGSDVKDARASLYKRAVVESAHVDSDLITWTSIISDADTKTAIDYMSSYVPMASTSAKFTETLKTVVNEVYGLMPLNPLKIIQMPDQDNEVDLTVGESFRIDNIALEGLNEKNYEYYGFDGSNADNGYWIIVDEDGKELTDNSVAKITTNSSTGRKTLTAVSPGTVFLKYMINENKYSTWSAPDTYATNDSLTKTAVIQVNISEAPISIQDAEVVLSKTSFTFNGNIQKPKIKTIDGLTLTSGTDYTITWSNSSSKNVGTYTVTIKGKGKYTGTTKATYKIVKAKNPLAVTGRTATVKYSKLKSSKQTLLVSKVLNFSNKGKGTRTYTKVSGNSKIVINKTTGKVTVKKGLKKGTYSVKVKVKAAGNSNYKALTKSVTFKVKVS